MTLVRLLGIIRGRRTEVMAVGGMVLALALLLGLFIRPHYTAVSSIVLNLKAPELVSAVSLPGGLVSTHMATQIDIMQSERVIRGAVKALGLEQNPGWQKKWANSGADRKPFDLWAAEKLKQGLTVKPSTESTVLNISFSSDDAQFAAAFVNAMVKTFVATSLDMRLEPARQYSRYFDERAAALRGELERAQSRLLTYKKANGLIVTDQRVNLEVDRLRALNTEVSALQASSSELAKRSALASAANGRVKDVLDDRAASALNDEIARQEATLGEMSQRLGDRNPALIAQRSRIAALSQQRNAAVERALGGIRTGANVSQAQLKQAQQEFKAQQATVMGLEAARGEAGLLERDIENAQRAYDAVLAKSSQANLQSGDSQSEVSILQVASTPAAHPLLHWLKFGGGGLAAGAIAALLFVFMREQLDRRTRNAADITKHLHRHLLVCLPAMRSSLREQLQTMPMALGLDQAVSAHTGMKKGTGT